MNIAKWISGLGVIAMGIALMNGFVIGDFSSEGAWILSHPWGIVSLTDLYVGFALFALWIFFRESDWRVALIWTVLLMILGFFIGALYVFITLHRSKGDFEMVMMGHRRTSNQDKR